MSLLDQIKTQSQITDTVIVSFSMGKDSIVTLDLAKKYFKTVYAFFMYLVPDLEFQEDMLKRYEDFYDIEILRVPHFENADFYRFGSFREPDYTVPRVKIRAVYEHIRQQTGAYWIAGGEKISDSIVRRAMLKHSGSIDIERGRFFPLTYWRNKEVLNYINAKKLIYPRINRELGFSLHSLQGKELYKLRELYPNDYERVLEFFPEAQAGVLKYEKYDLARGDD